MKTFRKEVPAGVLALAVLLLLSSCNFVLGLFNPLLGTWELTNTTSGITVTMDLTINYDNTYAISGTISGSGVAGTISGSGTYAQDSNAKTMTVTGSVTTTYTAPASSTSTVNTNETDPYSISGKTLTVTTLSNGVQTYTKK